MIKIGLTGGIGSGKSTVARVFEILGNPVFYADDVAKLAYSDPTIREAVASQIGNHVLSENGVNKEMMRKEIFNNEKNLIQFLTADTQNIGMQTDSRMFTCVDEFHNLSRFR